MLNRIILIGRLTADPELRYTPTGTAVCQFTLAVDRQRKAEGQPDVDFINIVVWQKLGELSAQYLRKGRLAAVEGRLQIRSYDNKEGQKVRVAEVVAENVRFLERADSGENNQGGNNGQGGNNSGYQGGQGSSNGAGNSNGGQYGNGGGANFGGNQGGGNSGGSGAGGNYGGGQRNNDPFADDGKPIDISDDDLPF